MPIYEYKSRIGNGFAGCSYCKYGQEPFEVLQKINDLLLVQCPKCASPLEKLISKNSFRLEGSGWYKDGYTPPKSRENCSNSQNTTSPSPKTGEEQKH